jgi:hypothetical protein
VEAVPFNLTYLAIYELKISKKAKTISPKLPVKFLQKRQQHFRKNASRISPKWPTQNH